jgi:hypothetical protein
MNHLKMVKGKVVDTKPKKSKRQDKEVKKKQLLLFDNIRSVERKVILFLNIVICIIENRKIGGVCSSCCKI